MVILIEVVKICYEKFSNTEQLVISEAQFVGVYWYHTIRVWVAKYRYGLVQSCWQLLYSVVYYNAENLENLDRQKPKRSDNERNLNLMNSAQTQSFIVIIIICGNDQIDFLKKIFFIAYPSIVSVLP